MPSPRQVREKLADALFDHDAGKDEIAHMEPFGDAGLMTRDDGLLLKMADGSEFQVRIIRSR